MTTSTRIVVRQDRDTRLWHVDGMGPTRIYPTWGDAHTMATQGAAQRRRVSRQQRALVELHRPVVAPYPNAPGFHTARCPICDGRVARVRADGWAPYACRVWAQVLAT